MNNSTCFICQSPKAPHVCGVCENHICKTCAQFLDEDTFSFQKVVPAKLKHTVYCYPCFSAEVEPAIEKYNELMERAKNIQVFMKDQGKETRNFKRDVPTYKIAKCADREEIMLRLAFMAVEEGYNTLFEVDIKAEKIRNGSYQTQNFSATAMPANPKLRR